MGTPSARSRALSPLICGTMGARHRHLDRRARREEGDLHVDVDRRGARRIEPLEQAHPPAPLDDPVYDFRTDGDVVHVVAYLRGVHGESPVLCTTLPRFRLTPNFVPSVP